MKNFICNKHKIIFDGFEVTPEMVANAAKEVNRKCQVMSSIPEGRDILIASSEGGGGLSSTMGALFIEELSKLSGGNLVKNPYNAGNPDILNISSPEAKEHYFRFTVMKNGIRVSFDGSEFGSMKNTYKFGGIEVKCTFIKCKHPVYGEQAIHSSKTFNWGAHHRENNNLMGIVCDFIDGIPQIVLIMFSLLDESDWGKVNDVKNTKNTNGCVLNKYGINKMKLGWMCVIDDDLYMTAFDYPMWRKEFETMTYENVDIDDEDSDYGLW